MSFMRKARNFLNPLAAAERAKEEALQAEKEAEELRDQKAKLLAELRKATTAGQSVTFGSQGVQAWPATWSTTTGTTTVATTNGPVTGPVTVGSATQASDGRSVAYMAGHPLPNLTCHNPQFHKEHVWKARDITDTVDLPVFCTGAPQQFDGIKDVERYLNER